MKRVIGCCMMIILIQLLKMMVMADYAKDYGEKRIEIILTEESGISYKDIRLNEAYRDYYPILSNRLKHVTSKEIAKEVTVIGTTSHYEQLEHLKMVDGAFWGEDGEDEERGIIVISDELAKQLVGSCYAVGHIIHLNKEPYEVVGVYKKYHRLRDYIVDSGEEEVYIPITSKMAQNTGITFVDIDGTYLDIIPNAQQLGKMGLNPAHIIKSDQITWMRECRSLSQLPMIIVWLLIILLGGGTLYKRIIGDYQKRRLPFGDKWLILWGIVYLVSAIILFKVIFSRLYIRSDAMPQENIFDLQFYWNALRAEWVRHNQFMRCSISTFEQAQYLLKHSIHLLNIIQLIGLIRLGVVNKGLRDNGPEREARKYQVKKNEKMI